MSSQALRQLSRFECLAITGRLNVVLMSVLACAIVEIVSWEVELKSIKPYVPGAAQLIHKTIVERQICNYFVLM